MSEKKKKSLAKTVCGEHSWTEYGQICLKEKTYKKNPKKLIDGGKEEISNSHFWKVLVIKQNSKMFTTYCYFWFGQQKDL